MWRVNTLFVCPFFFSKVVILAGQRCNSGERQESKTLLVIHIFLVLYIRYDFRHKHKTCNFFTTPPMWTWLWSWKMLTIVEGQC